MLLGRKRYVMLRRFHWRLFSIHLVFQEVNVLHVARFHTRPEGDVFDGVRFHAVTRDIWSEYVVPKAWDAAAVDILLESVFCKDPLPDATRPVPEPGVPEWLWRQEAVPGVPRAGHEKDIRAVLHRVAGGWAYKAWQAGLFDGAVDARAFYDEMRYLLVHRIACPDVAALAHVGLDWA